uniref:Uncharacterized protein n=1 Tax=Globodera rostochiensis TaxID=31243 RepID=A0A914I4T4_GLORO
MALLCAATADCIVPIGQTKEGPYTKIAPNLTTHRHDQSLLGILRYNMEYRHQIQDPSFLPQISRDHPGMNGLFYTNRYQTFGGSSADWLHKVQCC